MRISLVTEGTYPTAHGGVSVWCDQLIRGLPEHEFDVQAIVALGSEPVVWPPPPNIGTVRLVPLWGATTPRRPRRPDTDCFREALTLLLDTMFRPGPGDVETFLTAIKGLRQVARSGRLNALMRSATTIDAVLERWQRQPVPGRTLGPDDTVPVPSVSDAVTAITLLEHFLRPLGVAAPVADVCHTVSNGLASLVALNAKWERGTPFLLTEHGIYLRERYLEYRANGYSFPVRALLLRFFRLLTAASYIEADFITPGSEYNQRWQVRHGASPERVRPVYNGIDPTVFPWAAEPELPTLAWLGRITPIKDLETLIAAFAIVVEQIPQARLRLFGSAPPGDEDYLARCVAQVDELRLSDRVSFEGRVGAVVEAYHAGNVVVLSSASEGFPYTVIEAMASGRATVSTDVGGVREAVGDTGLVVPPRDPAALAGACVQLLRRPKVRARLADAARQRAQARFTLEKFLAVYREVYPALVASGPEPTRALELVR